MTSGDRTYQVSTYHCPVIEVCHKETEHMQWVDVRVRDTGASISFPANPDLLKLLSSTLSMVAFNITLEENRALRAEEKP